MLEAVLGGIEMKLLYRYGTTLIAVLALTIIFQNCGQPGSISTSVPISESLSGDVPVQDLPPLDDPGGEIAETYAIKDLGSSRFICEPFGNMNAGVVKGGLKAELAYVDYKKNLTPEAKNAFGSMDYFSGKEIFIKSPTPIYLSQINVPTRHFDQGFRLSDGSYLAAADGIKLVEWFALNMNGVLKLSPTDEAGFYEIAIISDDGSRLFVGDGDSKRELINNDGAHSARMKCAATTINFTKETRLPLTYYYNQGPRTEIANVMVWRKSSRTDGKAEAHALCGASSQTQFWNPKDSAEGPYWAHLKEDGWQIIDAVNFELPETQSNPCATQNTNLITKKVFSEFEIGRTTLNLDFAVSARIKAKLFLVEGAQNKLLKSYDFSGQSADRISVPLELLESGSTYFVEILIEIPNSGTQVLNEVRFQVIQTN